jgi:phage terminase small subunit
MNPKQKRFVEEYLIDLNATAAYRRAGYTAKGNAAEVNAARLLRNAKVQKAVTEAQEKRSERTAITADYVLQGIQEVAERCMQRAAVMEGRGEDRRQARDDDGNHVWEFDATGANKAFELLGKHLKLFTDKVDHSSSDGSMSPPSLADFYGGAANMVTAPTKEE